MYQNHLHHRVPAVSCLSISAPLAHPHSPICNTLTPVLPHHLYLILLNPAETHDLSEHHSGDSGILLTIGLQQVNPFCLLSHVDNKICRLHKNPNMKTLQRHEQKLGFFFNYHRQRASCCSSKANCLFAIFLFAVLLRPCQ